MDALLNQKNDKDWVAFFRKTSQRQVASAAKIKHSPDQVWQKYLSFDLTPVNQFSLCDGPQVIHQSTDTIRYHLMMASDMHMGF